MFPAEVPFPYCACRPYLRNMSTLHEKTQGVGRSSEPGARLLPVFWNYAFRQDMSSLNLLYFCALPPCAGCAFPVPMPYARFCGEALLRAEQADVHGNETGDKTA